MDDRELAMKKLKAIALTVCALAALHDADNDATYQRYENYVKRKFPNHPNDVVLVGRKRMVVAASLVKDIAMQHMAELLEEVVADEDFILFVQEVDRRRGQSGNGGPNGTSGGAQGT